MIFFNRKKDGKEVPVVTLRELNGLCKQLPPASTYPHNSLEVEMMGHTLKFIRVIVEVPRKIEDPNPEKQYVGVWVFGGGVGVTELEL